MILNETLKHIAIVVAILFAVFVLTGWKKKEILKLLLQAAVFVLLGVVFLFFQYVVLK